MLFRGFEKHTQDEEVAATSAEGRGGGGVRVDAALVEAVADDLLLERSSTAERVADVLRRRITEGDLPPGTRLSEELLVSVMGVSRNTLREAFRLLTHERLLVHRMHRGVFVPELGEDDLVDLYRLRRSIECRVLEGVDPQDPGFSLDDLRADVQTAERAQRRGDWREVGTANMRFHRHLVGLAGSRRVDEVADRVLAELRLLFSVIDSPRELHEPYVSRNRRLLELLEAGDAKAAAAELDDYLRESEATLLAAFRAKAAGQMSISATSERLREPAREGSAT